MGNLVMGTYWAFRNFQEKYGLPVDGMLGEKTKKKLSEVSKLYKDFVHEQINKGNRFTHYGGIALEQQVKNKKPATI